MRRLSDTEYEIMDFAWSVTPPFTTAMVMEHIGDKPIRKLIFVPGRLLNIVC